MCTVDPTLIRTQEYYAPTSIVLSQRVLARDGGGEVAADGGRGRGLRDRPAAPHSPPPTAQTQEKDEDGRVENSKSEV